MAVMIIQLFQFIFYIARSDLMEQNYNLLFENKIGCVANLLGFNDGEREILKTAAWISLNNMMLSQSKNYTEDEIHIAQWMLVIRVGKNVQEMLHINNDYSLNNIWRDFEQQGNTTMNLINYLVERCR